MQQALRATNGRHAERPLAEILEVDQNAIVAAFLLRELQIAHAFAHNKFMLIQSSAMDEYDEAMLQALAAVDPPTALDARMQLHQQLAELGRSQIATSRGDGPRV